MEKTIKVEFQFILGPGKDRSGTYQSEGVKKKIRRSIGIPIRIKEQGPRAKRFCIVWNGGGGGGGVNVYRVKVYRVKVNRANVYRVKVYRVNVYRVNVYRVNVYRVNVYRGNRRPSGRVFKYPMNKRFVHLFHHNKERNLGQVVTETLLTSYSYCNNNSYPVKIPKTYMRVFKKAELE
ncbi:hypothetical protein H8356DRAFT_1349454 [Neocallimastix lanati (nom. inval.)]|nr:hypothetical protein H8356DRAFT_1349454 [Neocallimastix sp. JGI-2020a]